MRTTIDSERKSQGLVSLVIFSCFLVCSYSFADSEDQKEEAVDTTVADFTRLDTQEAIEDYRLERYSKAAEGLAESKLSDEHRELLAKAFAEMYLGVPVSSYTNSERTDSSSEEDSDSSAQWFVTEDGRIQDASESTIYALNSQSPFVSLPPIPFEAATGKVVEESDTEVKFAFDMDMAMDADTDEEFAGLAKQMKWVAEVVVGKHDQSPMSLVMKLDKPVRKRFLFKLDTLKIEMHYSYIENCAGYAVDRMVAEMDGSAIIVGKLYQLTESTFTEIECAQPIVRLIPDEYESDFLQF